MLCRASRRFFCSSSRIDVKSAPIGLIGLGNVGGYVAQNLRSKGFNLCAVYDRNEQLSSQYGDVFVNSSAELASRCEIIVTALPLPDNVRQVMCDSVIPAMRPNSIWIDHSTTDYEQTLRLAAIVERERSAN